MESSGEGCQPSSPSGRSDVPSRTAVPIKSAVPKVLSIFGACVNMCTLLMILKLLQPPATGAQEITLRAQGASFPEAVYQKWGATYRSYRLTRRSVSIHYSATGSAAGRDAILNKPQIVDFVGTDNPLSSEDLKLHPDLAVIPTIAGAIVIAYNIPTCTNSIGKVLNLSREHVVGMFNGTFTLWSEPSIQAINPNCRLPNQTIIVVARRTSSGTTSIFTSALSSFDQRWNATKGTFSDGVDNITDQPLKWDARVVRYFGNTNRDVAGVIRSIRYTVGYLSVGEAQLESVDYAALGNMNNRFILPTEFTLQEAMNSKVNDSTLTPDLLNAQLPNAYPLTSYTYLAFYKTQKGDCTLVMELISYFQWIIISPDARKDAVSVGFSTLSAGIGGRVIKEVLEHVTCMGQSVMDMVRADVEVVTVDKSWLVPVAVTVGLMAVYIIFQRLKLNTMINMDDWNIPIEDIVFYFDEKMQLASGSGKSRFLRQKSVRSLKSIGEISEGPELLSQILQWPGKLRANTVGIRLLEVLELRSVSREMKKAMLWMRDTIINTNIVRFYGLTDLDGDRYVIGDYCSKGTILDVIQNGKYNLTNDFKLSLAVEIASGMAFLHVNGVVHGMLTSYCCLLDNRWTVKISDWEYVRLLSIHNPRRSPLLTLKTKSVLSDDQYEAIFKDFWTAPEILRSEFLAWPTPASDVYSYAIILQELFTRDDPYFELADHMSPAEILHAVVHNRLRPEPSSEAPVTIRQIMELAWSETPSARPTFEQITKMLRRSRTGRKTIMDNMMEAMEDYTAHLEEEMEAKESTIMSVKSDLDHLMAELVPSQFMTSLKNGEKVESRLYSALGVVMMELVEGSATLRENGVEKALTFLGALTSQLSQIIKKYDAYNPYSQVYQVQTYVLGFEKSHDSLADRCHATAHLALDILKVVNGIGDNNSPKSRVQVRLSAHIGSVATGTIGVTSPKFVLHGDGINAGRALLACSDVNVVKISRGLYSHIEKNPDFTFSSKDSEWITCNGIDIEAFILTGRHNDNVQIASDTSVDSGVYDDLSPIKSVQPRSADKTKSDSAVKLAQAKTFLPSRTDRRSEKSTLFSTTDELQTTTTRRSKVNGRGCKHQRATTRDNRLKGPSVPSVTEFPTAHLPSQPLSRISEQSDDSDTTGSGISRPQPKTGSSENAGMVNTPLHRPDVQTGPPSSAVHAKRHHRHQRHHLQEMSSVPYRNSHATVHRDFLPEMSHGSTKQRTSHSSKRTITRSRSADYRRNVSDSSCSDEDLDRKGFEISCRENRFSYPPIFISGSQSKALKSANHKRRRSHSQEPDRDVRHAVRRASVGSDVSVQDFRALGEGHGRLRTPKKRNKVYPL